MHEFVIIRRWWWPAADLSTDGIGAVPCMHSPQRFTHRRYPATQPFGAKKSRARESPA